MKTASINPCFCIRSKHWITFAGHFAAHCRSWTSRNHDCHVILHMDSIELHTVWYKGTSTIQPVQTFLTAGPLSWEELCTRCSALWKRSISPSGRYHFAAGLPLLFVNDCNFISTTWIGQTDILHAGAIAHTAVSAIPFRRSPGYGYHGSIGNSIVVVLYIGLIAGTFTFYEKLPSFQSCRLNTH